MLIRKAKPEDSGTIASLVILAMEEIFYSFIGEESREKAVQLLEWLIREKNNQYSYENCWVAGLEGRIVAAAIVYDGAALHELRKPVAARIAELFHRDFNPEDETQAGEFYIDSVAVAPDQQGRGTGTKLFQFLIDEFVNRRGETLGLLVDRDNPDAKRLYLKLGFKIAGEKMLAGKSMEHLQLKGRLPQA